MPGTKGAAAQTAAAVISQRGMSFTGSARVGGDWQPGGGSGYETAGAQVAQGSASVVAASTAWPSAPAARRADRARDAVLPSTTTATTSRRGGERPLSIAKPA